MYIFASFKAEYIKLCFLLFYYIDDAYDEYITSTESPGIGYNVEVKLIDLGENFEVPQQNSLQYEDLTNSIAESFKPVFTKLPGYRRVIVENIRS